MIIESIEASPSPPLPPYKNRVAGLTDCGTHTPPLPFFFLLLTRTSVFSTMLLLLFPLAALLPKTSAFSVTGDCGEAQDLGSTTGSWTLNNRNGSISNIPATVPGQVQLDLMRAGLLADPYFGLNSDPALWASVDAFAYERGFVLPPSLSACPHFLLVAEGLDTLAAVTLDGSRPSWLPYQRFPNALPIDRENSSYVVSDHASQERCEELCEFDPDCVGFTMENPDHTQCWIYHAAHALYNCTDGDWFARASPPSSSTSAASAAPSTFFSRNMHRRQVWDCSAALAGSGGGAHNATLTFAGVGGIGGAGQGIPGQGGSWRWIRKEADSYGWDWSLKSLSSGPTGAFYLVGVESMSITSLVPQILSSPPNPLTPLTDGNNSFSVNVTVGLWLPVAATIEVNAFGSWGGAGASTQVTVPLPAGDSYVSLPLSAANVALWWPHTHGAQAMYTLNVTASTTGSSTTTATAATASRRVGFRSSAFVAIMESPGGKPPQQFYRVNGQELFVMGANWVPADAFQARLGEAQVRDLLQSVVAANMNILRIWGGGIYNPDLFYDLCDELGIMVHTEGQFSDSDYYFADRSFDQAFLREVAAEAKHQAQRLAYHPSHMIWVGSNEICPSCWGPDGNLTNWEILYLRNFLDVVASVDASRPVYPLCPAYPWEGGVDPDSSLPNGLPLAYTSAPAPYSNSPWEAHFYRFDLCKTPAQCTNCVDDSFYPPTSYASEFGWVGAPSLETLAPYLAPEDYTLNSSAMAHHGNTFITMGAVYNSVLYNFGGFAAPHVDVPSAPAFRRALHFSMLSQADCIRAEVEHYRRGRDGPANTHGTMYWMLDAIWPSTSWDSLEFGGRWKLLHYSAREFYNPIALDAFCTPSITQCTGLQVHVGSELLGGPLPVNVSLDVVRFSDGAVTRGVASWGASISPGKGAFFTMASIAEEVLTAGGCASPSDCLVLVAVAGAATPSPLRPPAIRSLTLWADAHLPPASITVTPLGGGSFTVTSNATAPHTMIHGAELGHFDNNNLLLLPGVPQTTTWVPGPGSPPEPTGVYAVSINGGTPGMVAPGVLGGGQVGK